MFKKFLNDNKIIKPFWNFSQKGNLWRFIIAGSDIIAGETRDIQNRIVYFFTLQISTGKTYLKNFTFENGNYWISIEGATDDILFLHRYIKPEMPDHKDIIAIDIRTGKFLWENIEFAYLFNSPSRLFGLKQKFESTEIGEIDLSTGKLMNTVQKEKHSEIYELKYYSDTQLIEENFNYPAVYRASDSSDIVKNYFEDFLTSKKVEGNIEYIEKKDFLIFNYYVVSGTDIKDINRKYFKNIFTISDLKNSNILYTDIMSENSNYNVPDNFFINKEFLFYLKGKKEIVAIKL